MNNNKPSPPTHHPKGMKVDQAVEYLKTQGVAVSRRTLYSWFKIGVKGVRLQHGTVPNTQPTAKDREIIVVSPQQLDTFLAGVGVRGCR